MNNQEIQELLRHHPELKDFFVFVNRRSGGFWRRKANYDRAIRSKAKIEAELELANTSFKSFGKRGFDSQGLPIVASNVQKALTGKKFTIPRWQRVANELREALKGVAIVVESKE
jgi:hypothetical protein